MSTDNSFKKDYRLLNKSDFQNLRKGSRFLVCNTLLFYIKENNHGHARLGVAVSKKLGPAVLRNRIKRKIREYFRTSNDKANSFDILVALNFKKINKEKLTFECIERRLFSSLNEGFNKAFH